jgi:hypothetical protein
LRRLYVETKDKKRMVIRDIAPMSRRQYNIINALSAVKSKEEWIEGEEFIKVPITELQKKKILSTKDYIFQTPNKANLLANYIRITEHAEERAIERIEKRNPKDPDVEISPLTRIKIFKALQDSNDLHDEAEWKGRDYLAYRFISEIDGEEFHICVGFAKKIIIITVIEK